VAVFCAGCEIAPAERSEVKREGKRKEERGRKGGNEEKRGREGRNEGTREGREE
jgi:hypothetical protein